MLSGGSFVSWSVTWEAKIVSVHCSSATKWVSGVSVNTVGPPLTLAVWIPLTLPTMVNQAPLTFTRSSNVTGIVVSIGTLVAFRPGTVENTSGSRSPAGHRWGGDAEFRGSGGLAVKSAELLSMSLQPEWVLNAASVFPRSGAGPPPSKQVAEL